MAPPCPGPPETWALVDDRAGNRAQVLGVAEALGWPFVTREITYRPLARLPNLLIGATFATLTAPSRAALRPPWPGLVITAGRRSAPVARAIKRAGGGSVRLVQLMDPEAGRTRFDLLVLPCHDRPRPRPNLLTVIGAPHRMTDERLAAARAMWAPRLEPLPRPRIAALIGGPTRRSGMTEADARALGERLSGFAEAAGGSLMVTTSRRTGAAADALLAALRGPRHVHRWGEAGDNPLTGYLAVADAVVVTGDSVSMCCEACATGVPVYIWAPPGSTPEKHRRLHADLIAAGYARALEPATTLAAWSHPPLNPAATVAAAVHRVFGWGATTDQPRS